MTETTKLAIIITHPIQYYAPLFKLLAQHIKLKVFYTAGNKILYDKGFQQQVKWDIPLLQDYEFEFLTNTAGSPGTDHFMGIKNPKAISRIQDFQPSCLLIYSWANWSHLNLLMHFKGKVPILFRGDSTLLNHQSLHKTILKTLGLHWLYKHIDTALFAGTNNKAYFKKYGLKEERLIFVPHAVDNERFGKPGFSEIRKKFHIKESDLLLLFAGKIDTVKEPMLLLQAFKEVNKPTAHLLFVGCGKLAASLQNECAMHPRVHYLPFQNQTTMPSVYQACDLFCLPSKSDSWGLSVNEAMAAGLAVLTSDKVGAAADLVKTANGLIFKSGDLEDLKKALIQLTEDKAGLIAKGKASKKIIAAWNFDTQLKNILRVV